MVTEQPEATLDIEEEIKELAIDEGELINCIAEKVLLAPK